MSILDWSEEYQQVVKHLGILKQSNKEQMDLIKQLLDTVKLTNKRIDELENKLNYIAGTITTAKQIGTSLE